MINPKRLMFLSVIFCVVAGDAWALPETECDRIRTTLKNMWENCVSKDVCPDDLKTEIYSQGAFYAGLYISLCQTHNPENAEGLAGEDIGTNKYYQRLPFSETQALLKKHISIKKLSGQRAGAVIGTIELLPAEKNRIEITIDNQTSYQITHFHFSVYVGEQRYRFKNPPNTKIEPFTRFVHKYLDHPPIEGTLDKRILEGIWAKKTPLTQ